MLKLLQRESWFLYGGVILFIILNSILIYKEFFLFSLVPLALALILLAVFSMDKLLLTIVFFVPLSLPLSELVEGLPINMFLPTEPLLAGILLIYIFKSLKERTFDKKVILHPVSVAIYCYLFWIFITSVTSTMPIVSIKFLVSKLWFVVAFYFLAIQLFRTPKNARKYVVLYAISLAIVVGYATFRHMKFGIFDEKIAHWSANPFYKDHTSYGAMLAFYVPSVIALTFYKKYSFSIKFLYIILLSILVTGLLLSYSRAAWVSIFAAFGVWVLIKLRIKFWVVLTGISLFALVFLLFSNSILRTLKSNNQDSSTTSIAEHVQSISNISTDASNVERLNRWNCAIRMFKEKPIFGWGPGTYMFHYAPFQISHEKTIISTNQGDGGNAHSEYLGPLSEQGFLGPIFIIVIMVLSVITGLRAIKNTSNYLLKTLGLSAIIGLFTYYLHGILNNFLDTDKASVPFWGFTALLVAIDIYHKKSLQTKNDV